MKRALFGTVALAAMLAASCASADPAVSGLNGKISAGFGAIGPNDVYGASGSIDFSLGGSWGAQGDAYLGGIHGVGVLGGGGHIFWRDPSIALAGIYASDQHFNIFGGVDVVKVGGELEYYYSPSVTLRTIVGWEGGDVTDRLFDRTDIAWYPSDNWALTLGHRYSLGVNAGVLGAEYQIPGTSLAVTAQGRLGEFSTSGAFFALTWYLADGSKPLVDRARRDDPVDLLAEDVNAAGASGGYCNDVGLGIGDRKGNVLFSCR